MLYEYKGNFMKAVVTVTGQPEYYPDAEKGDLWKVIPNTLKVKCTLIDLRKEEDISI